MAIGILEGEDLLRRRFAGRLKKGAPNRQLSGIVATRELPTDCPGETKTGVSRLQLAVNSHSPDRFFDSRQNLRYSVQKAKMPFQRGPGARDSCTNHLKWVFT